MQLKTLPHSGAKLLTNNQQCLKPFSLVLSAFLPSSVTMEATLRSDHEAFLKSVKELSVIMDQGKVWVWDDSIIINDFKKIKSTSSRGLADVLGRMKAFYTIYFGYCNDYKNLASLFFEILETSPSIQEENKPLFEFHPGGVWVLDPYSLPLTLDADYRKFLGKDMANTNPQPYFPTTQPIPGLVHVGFMDSIIKTFKKIMPEENENLDGSKSDIIALQRTAVFLILLMTRRTVKKSREFDSIFTKKNIHRHYSDMIVDKLHHAIQKPASNLNSVLETVYSSSSIGGGFLLTSIFYLYYISLQDKHAGIQALLKATCMTHLAGTGLQLSVLFTAFKDLLCQKNLHQAVNRLSYTVYEVSLRRVISLYQQQNRVISESKTVALYPFCRIVNQNYHSNMGVQGNEDLCLVLAFLIDRHRPPIAGSAGASSAMWISKIPDFRTDEARRIAGIIYGAMIQKTPKALLEGGRQAGSFRSPFQRAPAPDNVSDSEEESIDELI